MSWFQKYEEFKALIAKFKHNPPGGKSLFTHINLTNPKLRNWLKRQRRQHKKWLLKEPSHMNDERSNLLTSIGFDFRFKLPETKEGRPSDTKEGPPDKKKGPVPDTKDGPLPDMNKGTAS